MNEFLRRLLNLPEQASTAAGEIDLLHFVVITTTMAGATGVFAVALWFTYRYRKRRPRETTPPLRARLITEIVVIGGLFTLFISFWLVGYQQYMRLRTPPADAMEIYVTGKQWMWKFAYPGGQRSNAVLVVPAGRPVKLIMTSRDVIHSFFIPAFRQKQDVLPGRYTITWFNVIEPGVHRVFCAEYCGDGHSRMWADVVALKGSDFDAWLEGEQPSDLSEEGGGQLPLARARAGMTVPALAPAGRTRTMADRGLEVAGQKGCLSCHSLDGQRHIGPSFRGLYGRNESLVDGRQILVDEAYLTRSMMEPVADIVAGYAPIMPTYLGQLQPAETAALLELIKSLRWPLPQPAGIDYPPLQPTAPPAGGTP